MDTHLGGISLSTSARSAEWPPPGTRRSRGVRLEDTPWPVTDPHAETRVFRQESSAYTHRRTATVTFSCSSADSLDLRLHEETWELDIDSGEETTRVVRERWVGRILRQGEGAMFVAIEQRFVEGDQGEREESARYRDRLTLHPDGTFQLGFEPSEDLLERVGEEEAHEQQRRFAEDRDA